MKYGELWQRLDDLMQHPGRVVSWYVEGQVSEASFTIVPLTNDTYTLYRPSGRGQYYSDKDADGNPPSFDTEAEVCQHVWDHSAVRKHPTA